LGSGSGWTERSGAPAAPPVGQLGADTNPPTYYGWALLCLLVFLPTAIVALVYASRVTRLRAVGDWQGAARSSRLARTWCVLSVVGMVVMIVLVANGIFPVSSTSQGG
jgi:hypothetical protein